MPEPSKIRPLPWTVSFPFALETTREPSPDVSLPAHAAAGRITTVASRITRSFRIGIREYFRSTYAVNNGKVRSSLARGPVVGQAQCSAARLAARVSAYEPRLIGT